MKIGDFLHNLRKNRFMLVLTVALVVVATVGELFTALGLGFMQPWTLKMMCIGACLWIIATLFLWVWVVAMYSVATERAHVTDQNPDTREAPVLGAILCTVVAGMSTWAIFNPAFTTFAHWANFVLWLVVLSGFVAFFPKDWKECTATTSEE